MSINTTCHIFHIRRTTQRTRRTRGSRGIAPSGLVVYDVGGTEIARKLDLRGSTGRALFVGAVAVTPDGQATPAIGKVVLYNGSGWPQVYNNEGVVLDDFIFSPPVGAP